MNKLKRLFKVEMGFTLIELLVAMTLLTTVVFTFSNIISEGMFLSHSNKLENTALSLAQEKMEEIKAAWPSTITDIEGKVSPQVDEENNINGASFYRTWYQDDTELKTLHYDTPTGAGVQNQYLFKVVVNVWWMDKGQKHSIDLVTYLTGR